MRTEDEAGTASAGIAMTTREIGEDEATTRWFRTGVDDLPEGASPPSSRRQPNSDITPTAPVAVMSGLVAETKPQPTGTIIRCGGRARGAPSKGSPKATRSDPPRPPSTDAATGAPPAQLPAEAAHRSGIGACPTSGPPTQGWIIPRHPAEPSARPQSPPPLPPLAPPGKKVEMPLVSIGQQRHNLRPSAQWDSGGFWQAILTERQDRRRRALLVTAIAVALAVLWLMVLALPTD